MAADVILAAPGFQTSNAFAAVSGNCVVMVPVPGMDGSVKLPPPLVVPFKAKLAQLPHNKPELPT